jgi:hypothetical protein
MEKVISNPRTNTNIKVAFQAGYEKLMKYYKRTDGALAYAIAVGILFSFLH